MPDTVVILLGYSQCLQNGALTSTPNQKRKTTVQQKYFYILLISLCNLLGNICNYIGRTPERTSLAQFSLFYNVSITIDQMDKFEALEDRGDRSYSSRHVLKGVYHMIRHRQPEYLLTIYDLICCSIGSYMLIEGFSREQSPLRPPY